MTQEQRDAMLMKILSKVNNQEKGLSTIMDKLDEHEKMILKLDEKIDIVRDELIKYMNTLAKDCTSKQEVIEIAQNNISNFENIAKKTIQDNGFNYNVTVEIGNFDFPTKTYGDITLPAGTYDSLKIKIGKSEGQNWWCVMFPPLCFVDVTTGIVPEESKKEMKEAMPEEEYSLISNTNNSEVNFKFKLIEFFENIKLMAKK